MPGTASIFMRKAGTQKSCSTSLRLDRELDRLAHRDVELRRGDLLAVPVVEEGPRELLADDAHVHRVGLRPSRRRSAPRRRRCTGATSRIAGIAVQTISSVVLPWIGGPSLSSSPGRMRKLHDAVEDDHLDQHEDRHRGDQQDVPQRVDLLRLRGGLEREPVDRTARPRCRRPTRLRRSRASSRSRRACRGWRPARSAAWSPRRAWAPAQTTRSLLGTHGGRILGEHPRQRSRPGHAGTPPPSGGRRSDAVRSGGDRRGVPAERPRHARGPVVGRRDAVMAAERLRELGRLAVADAVRDLADRQRCARTASPRRAPCAPRSGDRGTSCSRSRRRPVAAAAAMRRRGGRCRPARGRRGTRDRRWPPASSNRLVRWLIVAGRCVGTPGITCDVPRRDDLRRE